MAVGQLSHFLRHLRRVIGPCADAPAVDGQLLDRFIRTRDEDAFVALMRRHGPMVLGVCRRVLHDAHDAEDAFQATFLVLARKAGAIRRQESAASWLCRVAYRLAVTARLRAAKRRALERQASEMARARSQSNHRASGFNPEAHGRELRLLLDEELDRLPGKYHAPLVLCYLQGKTHEEAARELHWPTGTVKGRLARAREMLRQRLARRGLAFPASLAGALMMETTSTAAVPAALVDTTVKAVLAGAAGHAALGVISAEVAALVEGVTKTMFITKLKIVAAVVMAVGLLGTSAGLLTRQVLAAQTPGQAAISPNVQASEPRALGNAPAPAKDKDKGSEKADDAKPDRDALQGHTGAVLGLASSPDGKMIATASADKTVKLWDVAAKKESMTLKGHTGEVTAVAFSPDGKRLASGSADKSVLVWDTATGQQVGALNAHTDAVTAVAISPGGKLLVSASKDQSARLWDIATGKEIRQLKGHKGTVAAVALSPNGRLLVTGGHDKTALPWDLATGKILFTLTSHNAEVTAVAFGPDGSTLATVGADKLAVLHDTTTGKELAKLRGHTAAIRALAFSPDGKKLATAGAGKNVKIWDVSKHKELATLKGHKDVISAPTFSPDGKLLFTGSADKTVRLWDATK
jgi:RNA polymerase sigma factor (sigma-70 family)